MMDDDLGIRASYSGFGVWRPGFFGRGQPLSFTLSFGETPWFDEEGEIRRCDWLERNP
jgi:hypothetical protein